MADAVALARTRYSAFISYSHHDAAAAARLQRRIETYRLPRRARAANGANRLAPVFRDRDELRAAPDLQRELRDALAGADHLIVLCSPAAARSEWVTREIEAYRELRGDATILAALIDGTAAEAIPAALRYRRADGGLGGPIAADFRPGGDGRRLALLKLIAPLAGVGLDTLVQRDAARRIRRTLALAAASAVLTLAMAVLALIAVNARAAAEQQRAKAESLVEFMLTDLRKRLKGVGRLELLTAVNQRALSHYAGQNLAALGSASLDRRARLLHAMGEDDEKRGDLAAARRQFAEARRTTAALLAAAPADPARIFAHAQSEYWVGFAAWRGGDIAAAEARFGDYAKLAARLQASDPANPDWAMEAGYAASNLGMVALRQRGDGAAAQRYFQQSLAAFETVARGRRGDAEVAREIADANAWIADSLRLQRHFDAAIERRHTGQRQLRALLTADPANLELRGDLVASEVPLARLEADAGRPAAALRRLAAAQLAAKELTRADPANADLRRRLRMIDLMTVRLALDAPRAGRPDTPGLLRQLGDCSAGESDAQRELADFCRVLRARLAPSTQAAAEVAAIRAARAGDRLSARWGFDFASEIEIFEAQRGETG